MNFLQRVFITFALITSLLSACTPLSQQSNAPPFEEPDPETYVSIMPAILEYFYLRKEAVILGNTGAFYQRYPELEYNANNESGINTEAAFITSMRSLTPVDGNVFPEYYERIKISQSEDITQVLVHGMELYTFIDSQDGYSESGGEFKIIIFMRQVGESWQIFRTDKVTLQEWKNATP